MAVLNAVAGRDANVYRVAPTRRVYDDREDLVSTLDGDALQFPVRAVGAKVDVDLLLHLKQVRRSDPSRVIGPDSDEHDPMTTKVTGRVVAC